MIELRPLSNNKVLLSKPKFKMSSLALCKVPLHKKAGGNKGISFYLPLKFEC